MSRTTVSAEVPASIERLLPQPGVSLCRKFKSPFKKKNNTKENTAAMSSRRKSFSAPEHLRDRGLYRTLRPNPLTGSLVCPGAHVGGPILGHGV